MKAGHRIGLAALLLGAAAGGAWWWMVRSSTPPHIEQTDGSLPPAAETMAPATMVGTAESPVPALSIGEYRSDTSGLPPIDAPLAAQIPALRDAAARGNATAACRLAVIGSQCIRARSFSVSLTPEQSAAMARQAEENLRQQYADVSLEGLPERYRAHAQGRLDTQALQEFDSLQALYAWGRRCADGPPIPHDETLALLRQAALAGEPSSMVHYASGIGVVEVALSNAFIGFGGTPPTTGWLRPTVIDQWRREAAAVRRAGLERGDPEMLWFEFAFADRAGVRLIEARNPIDSAAALRAYAALIGGHSPESTATLGLSPDQAAEADRRSDAWAARARERGRRAEEVADGLMARGVSSCD